MSSSRNRPTTSALRDFISDFRYVAVFWNKDDSKATGVVAAVARISVRGSKN